MAAKTQFDWGTHVEGPVWIGDGTGRLPGEIQYQNPLLVVDVKAFGAVGDGTSDDTAAIQAALSVFSGTGWGGSSWGAPTRSGTVYFPEGTYLISSTLTYNGSPSFGIQIAGASGPAAGTTGATIRWNGSAGGTMFYAQGFCRSVIRDLVFDGAQASHHVLYCIQIDAKNTTQSGSPGSSQGLLDRVVCRIGTQANSAGIAFGHAGAADQIDTMVVRDPYITGQSTTTSTGILMLSGGNTTVFEVAGGTLTSLGYALKAPNVGLLRVTGTVILLSTASDFYFSGAPLQAVLTSVHSEQAVSAPFVTMVASGGPGVLHLNGCSWSGVAPADDVIAILHGMCVITGGDYANTRTAATIPKFQVSNPRNGPTAANIGGIHSRGAFYLNAGNTAALWPFADTSGNILAAGIVGVAGTYYDLYAMGISFSTAGDCGGTRASTIPLSPQDSLGGGRTFGKLRSASNDALTDVSADATIGLKKGDTIKFKSNGGAYTDADINALSKDSSDIVTAGGAAGLKTTGPLILVDGITAPSTISGVAQLYVDTSDGDLKIKFGDGTVKTITVDT